MKKYLLTFAATLIASISLSAESSKDYKLTSPNSAVEVSVSVGAVTTYSVARGGVEVIAPSPISMSVASEALPSDVVVLGRDGVVVRDLRSSVDELIEPPIYHKAQIEDHYNQMELEFDGDYSLIFRAYDSGVAYRFVTDFEGEIIVESEQATFNTSAGASAWVGYTNRPEYLGGEIVDEDFTTQYMTSFENIYVKDSIENLSSGRLIFTPTLVDDPSGLRVLIAESDLLDYPGIFLLSNDRGFEGHFAPYPAVVEIGGYNNLQGIVVEREDYIARTSGQRSFPWRIVEVVESDVDLLNSDMVYRLAAPSRVADTEWVKGGKVAWDWWNDWNIEGVDFVSGINTETYKYYIDFAADFGIEYVILDEGWAVVGQSDLRNINPDIDLEEIVSYANSRGVDIILWAGYWALAQNLEELTAYYADMGVKGFKVDFMDRDDQPMIEFMERAAQVAAENQMLLDFHGGTKPAGLQRTYPNVITFEAVSGLEQLKWQPRGYDQVTYDVEIPFIRMAAGPMDYTPGAMRNATEEDYHPSFSNPMSQGTRARQVAAYVVFVSPLSMLSDTPSSYRSEEESAKFIASLPTEWDESVALDGAVGEYVVVARRSGDVWYVGALNGWEGRTLSLDLGMLGGGDWAVEIFEDGVNADRRASDYRVRQFDLDDSHTLSLDLKQGGGAVAIISPR